MTTSPIVLAVDPSSTRTGYALMSDAITVVEAGYLTPERVRDSAIDRVGAMCTELAKLIREGEPVTGVIEIPSGRPGRGSRAGGRSFW